MDFLSQLRNKLPAALLILTSQLSYAAPHFYIKGEAGWSNLAISNTNAQIHYYNGFLTDGYPTNNAHTNNGVLGLGTGFEFTTYNPNIPYVAIGLDLATLPNGNTINGQVNETPLGDPTVALYNYKYKIYSTRLLIELQTAWLLPNNLLPYINIGIGAAANRTSDYHETTINNGLYPPLPPFSSNTEIQLAYQFGVGIGYAFRINPNANFLQDRVSLGYRYVSLGNASTGTRGYLYPFTLNAGRLHTNEVFITYSHFFN